MNEAVCVFLLSRDVTHQEVGRSFFFASANDQEFPKKQVRIFHFQYELIPKTVFPNPGPQGT